MKVMPWPRSELDQVGEDRMTGLARMTRHGGEVIHLPHTTGLELEQVRRCVTNLRHREIRLIMHGGVVMRIEQRERQRCS